jgi:hypothetical protein
MSRYLQIRQHTHILRNDATPAAASLLTVCHDRAIYEALTKQKIAAGHLFIQKRTVINDITLRSVTAEWRRFFFQIHGLSAAKSSSNEYKHKITPT